MTVTKHLFIETQEGTFSISDRDGRPILADAESLAIHTKGMYIGQAKAVGDYIIAKVF